MQKNGKYCKEESKAEALDNWTSTELREKQLNFQHRQVVYNFPHKSKEKKLRQTPKPNQHPSYLIKQAEMWMLTSDVSAFK